MSVFDTVVKRIRKAKVKVSITPEELVGASQEKVTDKKVKNHLVPLLKSFATASNKNFVHLLVHSDSSWHLAVAAQAVECLCDQDAKRPAVAAAGRQCCHSNDYTLPLHDANLARKTINGIANDYRQRQSPVPVKAVRIEGRTANGRLYLTG